MRKVSQSYLSILSLAAKLLHPHERRRVPV